MNSDELDGWELIKDRASSRWNKLTGDDLLVVAGHKHVLVGRLQHRYAMVKEEAEREVEGWLSRV